MPTALLCRADRQIPEDERAKISLFANMREQSVISVWDVACVFEKTLVSESSSDAAFHGSYELALEQVVISTLKSFMLSDFADFSASDANSYAELIGRFKFKPLPAPFMPKAPNSVFQLSASL